MDTYLHLFSNIDTLKKYIDGLNIDISKDLLVQIYINQHDLPELKNIHRAITGNLPNAQIIGAVIDHNIFTYDLYNLHTIISFTTFSKTSFRIFAYTLDCMDANNLGEEIIQNEITCMSKFAVMLSNINPFDVEKLIKTIKSGAPKLTVTGGIIPDYEKNRLFANDRFYDNGIIGYILDGTFLNVNVFTNDHYMPIGRAHIITNAKDNIIKTIDNMPANTFYEKYLGNAIFYNTNIQKLFPLLLQEGNRYLPKPMLSTTKQGYIITNTTVNNGDLIILGYGNIRNSLERNSEILEEVKQCPAENILIFSGLTRLKTAKNLVNYSITDESNINFTISGVYFDYEFVTNETEINVSTGTLNIITLSEDDTHFITDFDSVFQTQHSYGDEEMALLTLVENTTNELNILNQTLENINTRKTNELFEHFYIDDLTKLPNQNKLKEDIEQGQATILALIDVSSFVNINNFYGCFIGDKLLSELAKLISVFAYENQYTAYRTDLDVFAITSNGEYSKLFEEKLQALQLRIHNHCFMELSLEIYISTDIAISHNVKNLYENTGMTLEYAKGQKKSFLVYNEGLNIEEAIKNNLTWMSKIRNAIDKNCIVPYYQPIYNNITHETDHYEVLMRLIDDDGTVVTPNKFLYIAKKANLYKQLTRIIIEKAFKHFENSELRFSINLTSEDILDVDIRQFIYEKLKIYSKSHHVIFEIVESEGIENYDAVKEFIHVTKSFGVQIAIDDFGTGFSNFHYLFKLNVDLIKIDGSIIQQINGEKAATLVAETIVDFSKKMGIATVAEFVSDKEIFNKANELGINYSQGYYVSMPKEDTDQPTNMKD